MGKSLVQRDLPTATHAAINQLENALNTTIRICSKRNKKRMGMAGKTRECHMAMRQQSCRRPEIGECSQNAATCCRTRTAAARQTRTHNGRREGGTSRVDPEMLSKVGKRASITPVQQSLRRKQGRQGVQQWGAAYVYIWCAGASPAKRA